jgi:prepilin peptidase CpaA
VIPNPLNAAIALAAPLWWWASGFAWPGVAIQLAVGGGALLVFLGAFAIGAMGGGDVKLIAALGLWLVPLDFMRMIVWMSIGGGLLTVVMMVAHRLRKAEGPLEIPYGIAIALATIPELTQRYLYHFGR